MNNNHFLESVKLPFLALSKPAVIEVVNKLDDILICSKGALKNGFYTNLELIDSDGYLYKVQNATKVGSVGKFWGYDLFLDQTIKVELTITSNPQKLAFSEIKERIVRTINQDRFFWSSGGDLDEIKSRILDAKNFKSLINYFNERLNRKFKT